MLIRQSLESDRAAILSIVNEAAQAYRGVIPVDRWHDPYMSSDELAREISAGVVFWTAEEEGRLLGVIGIQDKGDVALVRHAYVAPNLQRSGVGTWTCWSIPARQIETSVVLADGRWVEAQEHSERSHR